MFPGREMGRCAAVILIFCVRCIWHITVISETEDKALGVTVGSLAFRQMIVRLGSLVIELAEEMTEDQQALLPKGLVKKQCYNPSGR